jgi:hypothetical protein
MRADCAGAVRGPLLLTPNIRARYVRAVGGSAVTLAVEYAPPNIHATGAHCLRASSVMRLIGATKAGSAVKDIVAAAIGSVRIACPAGSKLKK